MRGKRYTNKNTKCKQGAKAACCASKEWSARNNVLQIEKRCKTQSQSTELLRGRGRRGHTWWPSCCQPFLWSLIQDCISSVCLSVGRDVGSGPDLPGDLRLLGRAAVTGPHHTGPGHLLGLHEGQPAPAELHIEPPTPCLSAISYPCG